MPKDFRLTWWGQRWLDSLTHIDFANRIPRGARYARNGSVREVMFDKNGTIKARVKGSRPSPYKIEITVPQFPEDGKRKLVKEPSALLLYNIFRAGTSLVLKGCVVPKIMATDDGNYKIIWEPAMMDGAVAALVKELTEADGNNLAVTAEGAGKQESPCCGADRAPCQLGVRAGPVRTGTFALPLPRPRAESQRFWHRHPPYLIRSSQKRRHCAGKDKMGSGNH